MTKLKNQVGIRVREIRKSKDFTQFDLAKKVGLSLNMIGCVERGEKFPSATTFEKLGTALKVPVQDFFSASLSDEVTDKEKQVAIQRLERLFENTSEESIRTLSKIVAEIKVLLSDRNQQSVRPSH